MKTNFEEKLEALNVYYHTQSRQSGYTKLLKEIVKNNDVIVVLHKKDFSKVFDLPPKHKKVVSLNSLNNLIGRTEPLFIDNAALIELFSGVLKEIDELKLENNKLKTFIDNLKKIINNFHY